MTKDKIETVEDTATKIFRDALWHAIYHERGLKKAHRTLKLAKELHEKLAMDFTLEEALAYYEEENDDEEEADDVKEYAMCMVGRALHGIPYHEEEMTKAERAVSLVKAVLARGDFEIDEQELRADILKRMDGD